MSDDDGLIGNRKLVDGRTFAAWKCLVNVEVVAKCGLSCDDLPDVDYWQMWHDGMTPEHAAIEVLDAADFPFDDDV